MVLIGLSIQIRQSLELSLAFGSLVSTGGGGGRVRRDSTRTCRILLLVAISNGTWRKKYRHTFNKD